MHPVHWLTAGTAAIVTPLFLVACSDGSGPSDADRFADRIVYSRTVDGNTVLYTVNPDGSDARAIPLAGAGEWNIGEFAWSRDHSLLVFSAKPAGSEELPDLFVIRPSGGTPVNITNTPDADELSPTWSPDGKQIAFERNARIWIADADGSDGRELVGPNPSNTGNYYPDWSPDGTKLVYATGNGDLWTVNTAGPAELEHIRDAGMRGKPTWKPDGTRILFWEADIFGGEGERLMTIAPDGSDPQPVDSPVVGYTPVWSPDGTRIALVDNMGPDGDLWIVTPATSDAMNLGIKAGLVIWR